MVREKPFDDVVWRSKRRDVRMKSFELVDGESEVDSEEGGGKGKKKMISVGVVEMAGSWSGRCNRKGRIGSGELVFELSPSFLQRSRSH